MDARKEGMAFWDIVLAYIIPTLNVTKLNVEEANQTASVCQYFVLRMPLSPAITTACMYMRLVDLRFLCILNVEQCRNLCSFVLFDCRLQFCLWSCRCDLTLQTKF
jgi:hypothetical protein